MRFSALLIIFTMLQCSGRQTSIPLKDSIKKLQMWRLDKIEFKGVEIQVLLPPDSIKPKADVLLLPGWNYPVDRWWDSAQMQHYAHANNYRLIAPQMGKSIYATHYFPETRSDYKSYPTLLWLDSALEFLKNEYGYFTGAAHRNFIIGISTGARGGALICARKPGFFHAAALFSGDYDPSQITDDPLCTNVYGPYQQFSDRWKTVDNPQEQIGSIITPMFIAHGGMDKVVHVTQSIRYYDSLFELRKVPIMQLNGKYVIERIHRERGSSATAFGFRLEPGEFLELNISAPAGHNWNFWRSQIPPAVAFFNKR